MNVSSLIPCTSASAFARLPTPGVAALACACVCAAMRLRAMWRGSAHSGSRAMRRTKGRANQLTQMCAAPYSSPPPSAALASAVGASISEYSRTDARPRTRASTPTRSCACALGTTLAAHSARARAQKATKVGSATWHSALSTQNWKSPVTPRASSSSSRPEPSRARYTPPLPSGAIATRPAPSTRMLPSASRHGSIPCWKNRTSSAGSPKRACVSKKRTVSSCVASLVITTKGTCTRSVGTPAASAASWRTRRTRSAWYWNSDLPEGIPMS
mmetsp:Transcript_6078/g.15555  ORF Transcript_6078/g.15555 Transcript_6078/m.15555 type:complete len:272 (+) Transcript_6078:404-1219(+)